MNTSINSGTHTRYTQRQKHIHRNTHRHGRTVSLALVHTNDITHAPPRPWELPCVASTTKPPVSFTHLPWNGCVGVGRIDDGRRHPMHMYRQAHPRPIYILHVYVCIHAYLRVEGGGVGLGREVQRLERRLDGLL